MTKTEQRTVALSEALGIQMRAAAEELIEANRHGIAAQLLTSEDGGGGVGLRFGFQLVAGKVAMDTQISWSRKFKDSTESTFTFDDPENPALPGIRG